LFKQSFSATALVDAFSPYGTCKVEWPSKEVHSRSNLRNRGKVTGYVYMIFETERSVKSLLQDCSQEFGSAGEWYFTLKARRNQSIEFRQVQIIPWVVSDSSYFDDPNCRLDPTKTVFVGALHGMITAQVLFSIMNDLYDDVVFAGIDTDKHKYPIGSGRVTFRSHSSYFHAIESAFLEIRTSKFCKKVQIDPFLEDAWCMVCCKAHGPYFCRDRTCFRYYCGACWQASRVISECFAVTSYCIFLRYANHRPLMRHAPRSMTLRNDGHENNAGTYNVPTLQRYLSVPTSVPVAPLGGLAAVAAVARGTVPRQQHHAYQYMQLAAPYPATVYTSTMPQRQCHVSPSAASTPLISGINHPYPVSTSSPYIHQRLY
uniref:RRM domain-containing protein n=1 Tax=Angiostrongylus cantonensis TaxID=6313 RepID=A0A0K0DLB0_ANGCA